MTNILDNVLYDIRAKLERCNFDMQLYGKQSMEYQAARIILNTTLTTLKECEYIRQFIFCGMESEKIDYIVLYLGTYKVTVDEKGVMYD